MSTGGVQAPETQADSSLAPRPKTSFKTRLISSRTDIMSRLGFQRANAMTCLLSVELMLCLVMTIYIIHEPYIVKNIYCKNISSYKITKLNGFAPLVLGSRLPVD